MNAIPYLLFRDQCAEAFDYYVEHLDGEIIAMQIHADAPISDEFPEDRQDKVIHAQIELGETTLMASDSPPERYQKPQGISISLQVEDPREAKRKFKALADGGEVRMPFEETFWAKGFGVVVDRFGIPWMVNCE